MPPPSKARPAPAALKKPWFVLLLALVPACGPAGPGQGEGPGHREQPLALTPEQEVALGKQAYEEILSKSHVVRSGRDVERVRRVGRRIARAAEIEPLQREINLHLRGYEFDWEFNVLEDPHVNAFCLPGGKVAVLTGLLPVTENDDQLATVMSHEIAHALAHHASERIAREQMNERALAVLNGTMASVSRDERRLLIGLLGGGYHLRSPAYDRRQESEADHIGLFLMTFAGYDPDQAVAFWERMRALAARRVRPPEILSSHPSDTRRLASIRAWAPQAKGAYRAYREGRIAPAR